MALISHVSSHSKHAAHTKLVEDRGTIDTDLVFWLIQQAIPKLKIEFLRAQQFNDIHCGRFGCAEVHSMDSLSGSLQEWETSRDNGRRGRHGRTGVDPMGFSSNKLACKSSDCDTCVEGRFTHHRPNTSRQLEWWFSPLTRIQKGLPITTTYGGLVCQPPVSKSLSGDPGGAGWGLSGRQSTPQWDETLWDWSVVKNFQNNEALDFKTYSQGSSRLVGYRVGIQSHTVPLDTTGVLGGFRRATKYSVTGFKVHLLCNVSPLQPHRPVQLIPALLPRHIPLQEEPPLFISIEQHLRNW